MRVTLDTLKSHRFPAHGELTMDWQGPFLHTQARGPFNLELMEQGLQLAVALGATLWPKEGLEVELFEWHESMLMPRDAWDLMANGFRQFARMGRVPKRTLVVAPPDIEGRWLMLPRLIALWEPQRPVEVFDALAPALARVQSLLDARDGQRSA